MLIGNILGAGLGLVSDVLSPVLSPLLPTSGSSHTTSTTSNRGTTTMKSSSSSHMATLSSSLATSASTFGTSTFPKLSSTSAVPTTTSSVFSSSATTHSSISSSTSSVLTSSVLTSNILTVDTATTSPTFTYAPSNITTSVPTASATAVAGRTVDSTILVLVADTADAFQAYSGLEAYGIPYEILSIPSTGATIPTLNTSTSHGLYGGFIMLSEVAFNFGTRWGSGITDDQLNEIYAYQLAFGVRMVRLDTYPDKAFGVQTADGNTGCCGWQVEQYIRFTDNTGFEGANVNLHVNMTTQSIWHTPATIIDSTTTREIATFDADSAGQFNSTTTAAVINNFMGREQMVFFTSWAADWSPTSNFLMHGYVFWLTRGLFTGARKLYLSTQVDDVHLTTAMYYPQGKTFRLGPKDLIAHVNWMKSINSRMPAGSSYFMELGHNGNGDIINATNHNNGATYCNPDTAIYYTAHPITDLEYQKPVGTGSDIWPTTPANYTWSAACAQLDDLASWFMVPANRDAFYHISHTFSHSNLDNATYGDANKEIFFNQAWLAQVGISAGAFSASGLIPPAITGMHNGDVIKAWMDNGITMVVGDNSRPLLLSSVSDWWPQISTVAANGYDGLTIMPRWPTTIYFDCDLPVCTVQEWVDQHSGTNDFTALLNFERKTTSTYLLQLRHDPYMFHQANLRAADVVTMTIGDQTRQFSLIQAWVETVVQEMTRITTWPIVTKQHDDMAQLFLERMARDNCEPNLTYQWSSDGKTITGATVTSGNGNTCSAPIPVTFPGSATTSGNARSDKVGGEPLIMWATLMGSPVTFTLSQPIAM